MASDVTMPRLSDSMEEGTILKWLVSEGDEVSRGQELVEIETDKANMTYEADTDGTLVEIVAQEGDTLPIGEPIARIGEAGEAPSDGDDDQANESDDNGDQADESDDDGEESEGEQEPSGEDGDEAGAPEGDEGGEEDEEDEEDEREKETAQATEERGGDNGAEAEGGDDADGGRSRSSDGDDGSDGRVKASPVAKRMASDLGVELAGLEGSGPGGRIVKADVEAAAEQGPAKDGAPEPAEDEERKPSGPTTPEPQPAGEAGSKGELMTQDLTRLQQTVSRRMAESKATAPDYALHAEIDMSACIELRARLKEISDPAPSFNDMVVKACALALREFPRVNGAYRDGHFERYSRVNVGVAVAAQDTLVVPTLFDADQRSLGEISRKGRELIGKVRDASITPPELSGGTFTVSNLGMFGIDSFSAVINPPQAALLAVGALKKKPIVEDSGRIVARDMMSVNLVCDHRILYGADGAQFLARVRELLEQPLALAL